MCCVVEWERVKQPSPRTVTVRACEAIHAHRIAAVGEGRGGWGKHLGDWEVPRGRDLRPLGSFTVLTLRA